MGEVTSYTIDGMAEFIKDAAVVGTDLVLTRVDDTTLTIPLGGLTQEDLDTAVANLVDASPATLNTLNELAAALGDDPNFATTIATNIGNVKAGAMGAVVHGAVAGTARPAGYGAIHWIGSVSPTNAIDNDVWTDTSA